MYRIGKFILFGDSITQHANDQVGFALAPALQSHYSRKLDVVTRGFSGYNTNQGVVVLREVLKAENAHDGSIKLICIFMGTNDAAFTFQGVDIDTYKANLQTFVDLTKSYNIPTILVGPALHGRSECIKASESLNLDGNFSDSTTTRKYADVAAEVAAFNNVPFIDLWKAFQKYGGWSTEDLMNNAVPLGDLLHDGIHYTPKAYNIYYDELLKTIQTYYPQLDPANLPFYFPVLNEVDFSNIEASIMEYVDEHSQ